MERALGRRAFRDPWDPRTRAPPRSPAAREGQPGSRPDLPSPCARRPGRGVPRGLAPARAADGCTEGPGAATVSTCRFDGMLTSLPAPTPPWPSRGSAADLPDLTSSRSVGPPRVVQREHPSRRATEPPASAREGRTFGRTSQGGFQVGNLRARALGQPLRSRPSKGDRTGVGRGGPRPGSDSCTRVRGGERAVGAAHPEGWAEPHRVLRNLEDPPEGGVPWDSWRYRAREPRTCRHPCVLRGCEPSRPAWPIPFSLLARP